MTDQKTVTTDSASVVGSSLLAFGAGICAQTRTDVKNSFLLASLVAAKNCDDTRPDEHWFNLFIDAMRSCGWVIANRTYDQENTTEQSLKLSNIVLDAVRTAATSLIGGSAVSAVLSTLADQAMQNLPKSDKAMELFKRNVSSKASASVGLAACKQTDDGEILMAVGAVQHMSSKQDVEVLFFDWDGANSTTYKGTVALSFSLELYRRVRDTVESKIASHIESKIADYEI